MRNVKLSTKMYAAAVIPLILLGLLTFGIFVTAEEMSQNARLAREESFVFAGVAKQMRVDVIQVQQWLTDISATRGLDGLNDGFDEAASSSESFLAGIAQFEDMYREENDTESFAEIQAIKTDFDTYYKEGRTMAQAYVEQGPAGGNKMMANFDAAAEDLAQSLEPFIEQQSSELETAMEDIEVASEKLKHYTLVGGGFAIFLGMLASWLSVRMTLSSIVKPLSRAMGALTTCSERVASASQHIASSSQLLAEGATQQAASLEESSSALEELSSQAEGNAEAADNANDLTQEAIAVVGTTGQAMEQMVDAMHDIKQSSSKISGIIKTIEEIAFQTNLLALNAAVEAARAGEQGKGFAVVAEEVRNLAQRSAAAARDTTSLIESSVDQSHKGAIVVEKAAKGVRQVAESSSKVAEKIEGITTASNEQSEGIGQINNAVSQMDRVTQQMAANAEESASASEELSAQAVQMQVIVDELSALVNGHDKTQPNATPTAITHQLEGSTADGVSPLGIDHHK